MCCGSSRRERAPWWPLSGFCLSSSGENRAGSSGRRGGTCAGAAPPAPRPAAHGRARCFISRARPGRPSLSSGVPRRRVLRWSPRPWLKCEYRGPRRRSRTSPGGRTGRRAGGPAAPAAPRCQGPRRKCRRRVGLGAGAECGSWDERGGAGPAGHVAGPARWRRGAAGRRVVLRPWVTGVSAPLCGPGLWIVLCPARVFIKHLLHSGPGPKGQLVSNPNGTLMALECGKE